MIYNHIMVFFITLLVLSLLRRAAPRLGLMDTPGAHHYHDRPTPMVGGLAIFTAFFFGVLLADVPLNSFRPLFLGCGILVLVGVLDDVHLSRPQPERGSGDQVLHAIAEMEPAGALGDPHDLVVQVVVPGGLPRRDGAREEGCPRRAVVRAEEELVGVGTPFVPYRDRLAAPDEFRPARAEVTPAAARQRTRPAISASRARSRSSCVPGLAPARRRTARPRPAAP